MLIRRFYHFPLLCLLVLSLVTSTASSFGYVWCLSADGHAEVETAIAGDCGVACTTPSPVKVPALSLNAEADDSGACLDVSTSHPWGSPRTRDDNSQFSPLVALAPITIAIFSTAGDQCPINRHRPKPTPRIADPLQLHRTVVLLI